MAVVRGGSPYVYSTKLRSILIGSELDASPEASFIRPLGISELDDGTWIVTPGSCIGSYHS